MKLIDNFKKRWQYIARYVIFVRNFMCARMPHLIYLIIINPQVENLIFNAKMDKENKKKRYEKIEFLGEGQVRIVKLLN